MPAFAWPISPAGLLTKPDFRLIKDTPQRMTSLRITTLVVALAMCAAASQATTITYTLSSASTTFSDGNSSHGTLTGTIAVDTATDLVTAANLTFNVPGYSNPVFANVASSTVSNGVTQSFLSDPNSRSQSSSGQLALFFNTASVGSGTIALCTSASICGAAEVEPSFVEMYSNHGTLTYDLTGGTFVSAQPSSTNSVGLTPEPSSLVLLGTGILGVAGSMLIWPARFGIRPELRRLKTPV